MVTLLESLRKETKDIHLKLHKNALLHNCFKGTINKKEYIKVLNAFYFPWQNYTSIKSSSILFKINKELQIREQAILKDLKILGEKPNLISPTETEHFSVIELLGIAYVSVGSSQGAQLLKKSIEQSNINLPLNYFSMTPKASGWEILENELKNLNSIDYKKSIDAAIIYFNTIATKLEV